MYLSSVISFVIFFISFAAASPHRPSPNARRNSTTGLDSLIKSKGKKYFGVAADPARLTDAQNGPIIQSNFGSITPESVMKWAKTEPTHGSFTFSDTDTLMNWAKPNGRIVRGHTLLWHRDLPDWVRQLTSKDDLHAAITNHVSTLVGRYAGQIYAWDVVNEILADDGTLRAPGRDDPNSIFTLLDPEGDFVGVAFRAARKADPNAKLYINDYSLDDPSWPKVPAMVSHVQNWIAQGIPIDGIASQCHLSAGKTAGVGSALDALAGSGVGEVAITELDVVGAAPEDYDNAVQGCLGQAKCVGITTWGISDKDSWLYGQGVKPLLWDENFQAKPAYGAVVGVLGG